MAAAHAAGGLVVVVAVCCFLIASVVCARFIEPRPWLEAAGKAVMTILAAQLALGAVTLLGGRRPAEPLHFLYGVAAVGVFPLAGAFAAEAPPRARSGVMAVASAIALALVWRAFQTG
jgi:hypothetical protein